MSGLAPATIRGDLARRRVFRPRFVILAVSVDGGEFDLGAHVGWIRDGDVVDALDVELRADRHRSSSFLSGLRKQFARRGAPRAGVFFSVRTMAELRLLIKQHVPSWLSDHAQARQWPARAAFFPLP